MTSRRPPSQADNRAGKFWPVLLGLGLLLALGAEGLSAGPGPAVSPRAGALASLNLPQSPPSPPHETVTLDPFYLLREEGNRVWVERCLVTLELNRRDRPKEIDLTGPGLRAVIYGLLNSDTHLDELLPKTMNSINKFLRGNVVADVKMSRSVLLLR
ncbi:MAG: hypothetical protein AB1491_04170 [Thermodesulfobacteriota bacterium]